METVPVPIMGGYSRGQSDRVSCQEAINVYFENNANGRVAAYGMPGLSVFSTFSSKPRAMWVDADWGLVWAVHGSNVSCMWIGGTAPGAVGLIGTIGSTVGRCFISRNINQVCFADGTKGYIWNGTAFSTVTDADFPASTVGMINLDGYSIAGPGTANLDRFYISALNDFGTWDATDYATAEARADYLTALATVNRLLFLFGGQTTEVWSNVGLADFPFQRLSGGVYDIGCGARHSIANLDQNLYWVDNYGRVVRSAGGHPDRVSTHEIEKSIQSADTSTYTGLSFTYNGHSFYQLNLSDKSWVFDEMTGLWMMRQSLASRHRCEFASLHSTGTWYFGDYDNGNIYTQAATNYLDGTDAITKRIVSPHIENGGKRQFFSRINLGMQANTNGTLTIDDSDDYGLSWNTARTQQFAKNMIEHRFNSSRVKTFRITSTSSAPFVISDAWADVEVGRD